MTHQEGSLPNPAAGGEGFLSPKFNFWVALATGVTTLLTFLLAIATPPLSGQLCQAHCFTYPYLGIVARFPRDYYWMLPAIVATLLYVAFTVVLCARVAPGRRQLAQLGLALSTMAAMTLVAD